MKIVGVGRKVLTLGIFLIFQITFACLIAAAVAAPGKPLITHQMTNFCNLLHFLSRLRSSCLLGPSHLILERLQRAIVSLCKRSVGLFSCSAVGSISIGLLFTSRVLVALRIFWGASRFTRIRWRSPSSTSGLLCRTSLSSTRLLSWTSSSRSPARLFSLQQPVLAKQHRQTQLRLLITTDLSEVKAALFCFSQENSLILSIKF